MAANFYHFSFQIPEEIPWTMPTTNNQMERRLLACRRAAVAIAYGERPVRAPIDEGDYHDST